jgi:hypothetical protein
MAFQYCPYAEGPEGNFLMAACSRAAWGTQRLTDTINTEWKCTSSLESAKLAEYFRYFCN